MLVIGKLLFWVLSIVTNLGDVNYASIDLSLVKTSKHIFWKQVLLVLRKLYYFTGKYLFI